MRIRTFLYLLAALVGTAALTDCTLNTDYFSEYRGSNLIANYPFTSTNWKLTDDTTSNPTPSDYMNWASAATTGPDGSMAYRLEIKNLINNGDFETASLDSFWTATTPSEMTIVSGIHNNALYLNSSSTLHTFTLNLWSALGALNRAGNYRIQMNFQKATSGSNDFNLYSIVDTPSSNVYSYIQMPNNTSTIYSLDLYSSVLNIPTTTLLATTFSSSTTSAVLQFGDGTITSPNIYIDDLTMVRGDVSLSTQLSLPSINSGTKTFLPGSSSTAYTFSLYVTDDITCDQTSGSHVANRIYPSGLTIQITGGVKSGATATYKVFFARPSSGWTSWTKLTMSLGLDFVDSDSQLTGPALLIQLTPTNDLDFTTGGRNSGSLLVASPSFLYNP